MVDMTNRILAITVSLLMILSGPLLLLLCHKKHRVGAEAVSTEVI